ncbi:hypothetical protein GIS00_01435 [Nakamurella sp. YIM 132087]|uniref:Uncharacterized protein n=1 Tax=Nakamurella alba TaxID=2665158 RepID=A0A7K1FEV0_9ACTN|nr:hypothetical protein [Nakamurella alba]MTD12606.1 hypothetical protein [Nakamurella alba]
MSRTEQDLREALRMPDPELQARLSDFVGMLGVDHRVHRRRRHFPALVAAAVVVLLAGVVVALGLRSPIDGQPAPAVPPVGSTSATGSVPTSTTGGSSSSQESQQSSAAEDRCTIGLPGGAVPSGPALEAATLVGFRHGSAFSTRRISWSGQSEHLMVLSGGKVTAVAIAVFAAGVTPRGYRPERQVLPDNPSLAQGEWGVVGPAGSATEEGHATQNVFLDAPDGSTVVVSPPSDSAVSRARAAAVVQDLLLGRSRTSPVPFDLVPADGARMVSVFGSDVPRADPDGNLWIDVQAGVSIDGADPVSVMISGPILHSWDGQPIDRTGLAEARGDRAVTIDGAQWYFNQDFCELSRAEPDSLVLIHGGQDDSLPDLVAAAERVVVADDLADVATWTDPRTLTG